MVFQILLWVCVAMVAVMVLGVVLPLHITLRIQSARALHGVLLLRPFGGVFPQLRVYDSARRRQMAPDHANPKPKKTTPKHRSARWTSRGRAGGVRGNPLPEALTLLRRVLHAFHVDRLHVDAEVGLGDPAETGRVFGQLCPVIYGVGPYGATDRLGVNLRPNFDDACFHGSAEAALRVTPIAVIWPLMAFGWRVFGPAR